MLKPLSYLFNKLHLAKFISMKKLILAAFSMAAFTLASTAQTAEPAKPAMSKEEKAKMKAKQEEDLTAALKELALTEDQSKQVREILADASKKSNELKAKTGITDADRDAEKQKINDEKNGKLKELMGKEKYSQWNAIRKKQKEAMNAPAAGN